MVPKSAIERIITIIQAIENLEEYFTLGYKPKIFLSLSKNTKYFLKKGLPKIHLESVFLEVTKK